MIVIYTPYGRTETTAAAVRLAELAVAAAEPVRVCSVGTHEARVHPFWDRHVVCGRSSGVASAAAGATVCVWFVCSEAMRAAALSASPKSAHVLVPSLHGQPRPGLSGVPPYEQVVCPSRAHQELFVSRLLVGQPSPPVTWARWDAGFPPVGHEGRAAPGKIRVLTHCDSGAIDDCPAVTLKVMESLLERIDVVELTCVSTKAWSRKDRQRLNAMSSRWGDRFAVENPGDLQTQLTILHDHDWFLYPAVRCDFGLSAIRAMYCGLPVLAWDVPPISEHVRTGSSGVLVPCDLTRNWCGAPSADALAGRFADAVVPYVSDIRQLTAMQHEDWMLKERSDAFKQFWLELFGAADR